VGLKPSASQGEARLRGLYRIIYSKTICENGQNEDSASAAALRRNRITAGSAGRFVWNRALRAGKSRTPYPPVLEIASLCALDYHYHGRSARMRCEPVILSERR
jgi:hypothetical protein